MRPALCLALLLLSLLPLQSSPSPWSPEEKSAMAARVRAEFLHSWNAYKQFAWGHDDLRPLSKSFRDWHSTPLLMTPVDSIDTMLLMGLSEEAAATREYIAANLSFDHDISVKNFEITIRILGGLLSSYQLTADPRLLTLAEDLGKRLLPAFQSPTHMPYVFVNLKSGATRDPVSNPAEIGTLLLEFGALSKLTGNPIYYDTAKRALVELYNRRSPIGLVGARINVESGNWTDTRSHVSGLIDSYYEYLYKCSVLFNDKDCADMWRTSIAALNKYVAHDSPTGLWYSTVDMNSGKRLATRFGALDAFFPGLLALSGDLPRARRLQDSAFKMWNLAGIEPEQLDYSTMKITHPGYPLRPEIIESAYILYYFTKDPRYLDMGRKIFEDLIKFCRTDAGYASLRNVETKEKADRMESFFLAETLKYLFLLFAPLDTVDLSSTVFNTEAHPFQISALISNGHIATVDATVCEVSKNPARFHSKQVRLKGTASFGPHTLDLRNQGCSLDMSFSQLPRTADLESFREHLQAKIEFKNPNSLCASCYRYRVSGTFVVRVSYARTRQDYARTTLSMESVADVVFEDLLGTVYDKAKFKPAKPPKP